MGIKRDDISEITDWSVEQFADWLRRGLLDTITGANPISRFEPLEDVIFPNRPIFDQLEEVYALLPAKAQDAFAEAIGRAARRLPHTAIGVECFRDLAMLSGLIGQNLGVGEMITKLDDTEFLGSVEPEIGQDAFALLFNVLAGLPGDANALPLLDRLITSPQFESEYAFMAFDALSRVDSNNLVGHLDTLKYCFDKLKSSGYSMEVMNAIVASIGCQVSGKILLDQLPLIWEHDPEISKALAVNMFVEVMDDDIFLTFLYQKGKPRIEISEWCDNQIPALCDLVGHILLNSMWRDGTLSPEISPDIQKQVGDVPGGLRRMLKGIIRRIPGFLTNADAN